MPGSLIGYIAQFERYGVHDACLGNWYPPLGSFDGLIVDNSNGLGDGTNALSHTIVTAGTALQLASDLQAEPITLNGVGFLFNGHDTGSLENISGNNTYSGPTVLEAGLVALQLLLVGSTRSAPSAGCRGGARRIP